jgi:hypothetical protein
VLPGPAGLPCSQRERGAVCEQRGRAADLLPHAQPQLLYEHPVLHDQLLHYQLLHDQLLRDDAVLPVR